MIDHAKSFLRGCLVSLGLIVFSAGLVEVASSDAWGAFPQASVGVNKFDLAQQYLGVASGGDGSAQAVALERALARKAIDDASESGIHYFRVAITGFAPSSFQARSDLRLWLKDPTRYWAAIDAMMDDLRSRDIKIIPTLMFNPLQFPSMTGDTLGDLIKDPRSRAWTLLARYVTEFITRYRGEHVILLYEMTNELNVSADINLVSYCEKKQTRSNCSVTSNFSSSELVAFTKRFYTLIKHLDPSVPISTGFALPRPSAEHLRLHPAFLTGKPDWTPDTPARAKENLASLNKYSDVLSVHIYPKSTFANISAEHPMELIAALDEDAKSLHKPLFIGEFGEKRPDLPSNTSFIEKMLLAIANKHIRYSALWVWEFYQRNTYLTYDTSPTLYNIEPGYTDKVIKDLERANERLGGPSVSSYPTPSVRVVITHPFDCQGIEKPMTAYAVASYGGKSVEKVIFRLDGEILTTVVQPPYYAKVPSDLLTSGAHRLSAQAFSGSGQTAQYAVTFGVRDKPLVCAQ